MEQPCFNWVLDQAARIAAVLRFVCLRRWLDILVLAAVAVAITFPLLSLARPAIEALRRTTQLYSPELSYCVTIILLAVVLTSLVNQGGLRWSHTRNLLAYPPAWTAAVVAVFYAILFQRHVSGLPFVDPAPSPWLDCVAALGVAAVLALCYPLLFATWRRRSRAIVTQSSSLAELAARPKEILIPWLAKEEPIDSPSTDLFHAAPRARRIATLFYEPRLQTVGLKGPQGGGKTSVRLLVEHYLHRDRRFQTEMAISWRARSQWWNLWARLPPRVITCSISAWGLRDHSGPVLVLRAAVRALQKHVDCLAINKLPESYVHAISGTAPGWLSFPVRLLSQESAEQQLASVEAILEAINARLIVFIEDLDRISELPDVEFTQSVSNQGANTNTRIRNEVRGQPHGQVVREMQALLDALREKSRRIGFVLAVGHAL